MDTYIIKLPYEIKRKIAAYLQVPYLEHDTISIQKSLVLLKTPGHFLSCYRYHPTFDWCHLCGEFLLYKPRSRYFSHWRCKQCNISVCFDCYTEGYKTHCEDHFNVEWYTT